ncbi:hypothetical protein BDZ97DRAFT_1653923, partial [Flammula alnicola]
IPAGHTFIEIETFVSTKGKDIAENLLKKAADRDPDAFDMYIYNDFFSYGVLDLVDKTLTTLHTKIKKKDWEDAYYLLEGLVIFVDFESVWTQCDDGDRVDITNKTIGAEAIAVFRGLDAEDCLTPQIFPSLETVLKKLFKFSEEMEGQGCDSMYGPLCKGIARRLFQGKTEDDFALELEQLQEWANGLDADEKKEVRAKIKKIADERAAAAASGKTIKPWYAQGKVYDEDDEDDDFKLSRVWKDYKEYLSGVPRMPLRGPAKWDISKWTAAERRLFEFAAMDRDTMDSGAMDDALEAIMRRRFS